MFEKENFVKKYARLEGAERNQIYIALERQAEKLESDNRELKTSIEEVKRKGMDAGNLVGFLENGELCLLQLKEKMRILKDLSMKDAEIENEKWDKEHPEFEKAFAEKRKLDNMMLDWSKKAAEEYEGVEGVEKMMRDSESNQKKQEGNKK